ncbi:MAG: cupin domain-containing protein [Cyclobacteriaceae bacterium]|nr:cupin domain-containing protein [Cyclobacteriaceae bacterium]
MINDIKTLEPREVMPGFWGRFVHTDNMTFAYWEIKQGSSLPEHSHMHEQVVNMLEGEFEIVLQGVSNHLHPGMVLPIPSHAKHAGRAITDCKILDVFYPVREDYKK